MEFKIKNTPISNSKSIVTGKNYRFTILTSKMIRMEYSDKGIFEDKSTQKVINRNFPDVNFTVIEKNDTLEIITDDLYLTYNIGKRFNKHNLNIRMLNNNYSHHATWYFGNKCESNLKGTARTLDGVDGSCELEDGLLSRHGYSVIDDSKSLVINENGLIEPGEENKIDIYFLGYNRNYIECLNDFYNLCGKTPMLPRYILGNWWSRYFKYTQESYINLMEKFKAEDIPISVAVFDMDWHYVDIDKKYGHGWTGYTWNEKLFPNHVEMLKKLKDEGIHTTLNVHPADGIRAHEKMYKNMAEKLGVDYTKGIPIKFDITNNKFIEAYFKCIHHPLEDEGIDFWWIDWQQGNISSIPRLDPLWMLNHYHFIDSGRNNKRPITFSRYAGIGSHRYPIGFSGDTVTTWNSLNFQPYFTSTASNAGYGWWSHDIGGHQQGYKDDELAVRWLEYGVFSPIMRLHSNNNLFSGKEPWNYNNQAMNIMKKYMRFRHQLIPYIYTMNRIFNKSNIPFIQPMYYKYPDEKSAYNVPNQYYFGSELIVNPITEKSDKYTVKGKVKTWLPEGIWFDIFTGISYKGNRNIIMYRNLDKIPVLAKSGSIIPMSSIDEKHSHIENPQKIDLFVMSGSDGNFELYEDDGVSMNFEDGDYVTTNYELFWNKGEFVINPANGNIKLIPEERIYTIRIFGLNINDIESVTVDNINLNYTVEKDVNSVLIKIEKVSVNKKIIIKFNNNIEFKNNCIDEELIKIINEAQIGYVEKELIYNSFKNMDSKENFISELLTINVPLEIKEMILEIILA